MPVGLQPRLDPTALLSPNLQSSHGQMDMESEWVSLFGGIVANENVPNDATSSVVGTASSLGSPTKFEENGGHDSDSDVDSLPHGLGRTWQPPSFPSSLRSSLTNLDQYILRISSRLKHNLSTIREERDQALQRWEQAKETNARLAEALQVEKARRAKLEEFFMQYKSTEIVHIPVWPPHTRFSPPLSDGGEEVIKEDPPFQFLYDNPLYQGYELNINLITLRVKGLISHRFPGKAAVLVEEALEKAEKLKYIPIYAKCLYWKGRILDLQGQRQEAAKAFLDARPCIGKYKEGEDLIQWLMEYEEDIEELHYDQQHNYRGSNFGVTRRRPPRRLCVPAAELPPTP
ncbi:uncharacterized protein CIMG_00274 [Coccidioides immitis RS]|uniref:Uncharacterized protein n=2 Tax=Coccidioides immitis TaxID=5501 RepID=J3KGN5_COCIM|nr:uncharacterized protein CIMG_00274 [Coccidioides immitis RS]EAS34920.3 hypothetical protein CIMG_00274 [Coccidioides immitis RS]KMP00112.1 hypothetical protein CIRG_00254 [Coccidioides immitis RMSCC 2394]